MTIEKTLSSSGISRPESEILLAYALDRPRTWVIAHAADDLESDAHERFTDYAQRRSRGEPVAYITGEKEFYGRMFALNASTLIPRPATELLVEQALHVLHGDMIERMKPIDEQIVAWTELKLNVPFPHTVIDIGTGSGCIAITLACERPDLHIIATDISDDALDIARTNAARLHTTIDFRHGNGFEPIADITEPFLIVSNPPYIPEGTIVEKDVGEFEPHTALFAGPTGRDVIDQLVQDAMKHPHCAGWVMECRIEQARI